MNNRPSNLEEVRKKLQRMEFGSRAKVAAELGVSRPFVSACLRPNNKNYSYKVLKASIKYLPEEIREGVKLEFN